MEYTSLYRRFRPVNFDEMVGQNYITRTIKNQIKAERIGHAYLFTGGRGTGKTTTAKILARAINCLNPVEGEPCNKCEICQGILSDSITDVVEMDAASNNGVDDIRAIRDEVNFLPTKAKYRVYIIDEVHMLSTGAFNALLKTLEEPPEHVKFILATTEPQKLPATILSRCQRFDFRRISNEDIVKRLKIICGECKLNITDEALKLIAVLSEGAMRDAISILERCGQFENTVDENTVKELVGIPKLVDINNLVKAMVMKDITGVLDETNHIIEEGKDIDNFLWEIIKYLKDVLIFKANGNIEIYSKEQQDEIRKISELISKQELLEKIYSLSELANNIKSSLQKSIMFEAGMIKECLEKENVQKQLERKVKYEHVSEEKNKSSEVKKTEITKTEKMKTGLNDKEYLDYWEKIINKLKENGKVMIYTNLIGTKAKKVSDNQIDIEFEGNITAFAKTVLEKNENREEIERQIEEEEGKKFLIRYIEKTGNSVVARETKANDKVSNEINFKINIVDE